MQNYSGNNTIRYEIHFYLSLLTFPTATLQLMYNLIFSVLFSNDEVENVIWKCVYFKNHQMMMKRMSVCVPSCYIFRHLFSSVFICCYVVGKFALAQVCWMGGHELGTCAYRIESIKELLGSIGFCVRHCV